MTEAEAREQAIKIITLAAGQTHEQPVESFANALLAASKPPKGNIIDDTGTVRKVLEWSVNPLNGRIYAEIEAAEAARKEAR